MIFLSVFLLFPIEIEKAQDSKNPPDDGFSEIRKTFAKQLIEFQISSLNKEMNSIESNMEMIKFVESFLRESKDFPKMLNNDKTRRSTERMIYRREEFFKLISSLLPGCYDKEMLPFLFLKLKNNPLPEQLTDFQKRLIKSGKGFENMVAEALRIVDEDKKSLEKQKKEADAKMIVLEKELQKILKEQQKPKD